MISAPALSNHNCHLLLSGLTSCPRQQGTLSPCTTQWTPGKLLSLFICPVLIKVNVRSAPPSRAQHHASEEQDDDLDDLTGEDEVLEGDFTLRAVLVGLLVGCVCSSPA